MFSRIFIEQGLENHPITSQVLQRFQNTERVSIERYTDVWGQVRKPYLQKRDNLQLFIAQKRGNLVREAPPAYGGQSGKHYYYIHAYNCIYECEYCYLQGHFSTPDLVLFVNHEEILKEMSRLCESGDETWFHAGEFSDSLALSHITKELQLYREFLDHYPNAKIELRTKSVNIRELLEITPTPQLVTSVSISTAKATTALDHKTPGLSARIKLLEDLIEAGHAIGLHLDPMVLTPNFSSEYGELCQQLSPILKSEHLKYISIGVVRFTEKDFKAFKQHYPNSLILKTPMVRSFDHKYRYSIPIRERMMHEVERSLATNGANPKIIYRCME